MFIYLLISTLVVAALSAALFVFAKVNWVITASFFAIAAFVISPLTVITGTKAAVDDATTFHEYWNGFETAATTSVNTCTRDGSCSHTYQCDPYIVPVTKTRSVYAGTDANGNSIYRTETYIDYETHYHYCPYSDQETSYYVDSTLDKFTIASSLMTGNPWRAGTPIPGGRQSAPAQWTQADERIKSGNPGPVTQVNNYKNYILASSQNLFEKYEGQISTYKDAGLLPKPVSGVTNIYHAQKLYIVPGAEFEGAKSIADDVAYLNAALGDDLHGDLHVVIAPENVTGGADNYSNALLAYWQSKELGRDAISKNSIIIVLGVNAEQTVSWARAFTGMPVGNEAMLQEIQAELPGSPLDLTLVGRPRYTVATETITHSEGKIENILFGQHAFARVSMSGGDADDTGLGFKYLADEIEPSAGAYTFMAIINAVLIFALGAGAVSLQANTGQNTSMSVRQGLVHPRQSLRASRTYTTRGNSRVTDRRSSQYRRYSSY